MASIWVNMWEEKGFKFPGFNIKKIVSAKQDTKFQTRVRNLPYFTTKWNFVKLRFSCPVNLEHHKLVSPIKISLKRFLWRFRISRTMSVRAVLVRLSVEQVCCQSQGVSLSLRSCLYLYYCVRFSASNPETTDAWLITEIYGYLKHLLGKNTSLKYMRRRYDFRAVWVWNRISS